MKKSFFCIFLLSLPLMGCTDSGHEDLEQWMNDSTKDIKGKVEPLPEIKPYNPVVYSVSAAMDPFQPTKIRPETSGAGRPDQNRVPQPLESFSLETLKYIGFMKKDGIPVAIVQAGETLHQVFKDNYMGQNYGQITDITEKEIMLRESVEDAEGTWTTRSVSLYLQDKN
ncbi:MAG: pilus assembly protein PilP [Betaproteobacteria bacterium]|nr:pilus assembly protein PilP [Betaproteobacteria bacterium]